MEYLRGLAAAVKPIHPGVGATEERQKCTTRERCEHQPAGGSAVGAGLQPGQAKEVWREPRRSTPQPLERRRAEASSSANCSHFCSHLANFRPKNTVAARLLKPTTASLLSSRSLVRIQQGAFRSAAGTQHQPHHQQKAGDANGGENPICVRSPGHWTSLPEPQRSTRDQKLQRPPKASRMRPTKLSWRSTPCQASILAAKSSQVRRCSAACR